MTIVVHKGVDLDAFGSALALAHVFGGKMFLPEPKNRNVARLSHAVQEWVTDSVEGNVIFCDTDSLGNWKAEFIFDHHGTVYGANSSAVAIWLEDCGYLQKMSENVLELLMSGIYEDTGFLRYHSAKPWDFAAVSSLRRLMKRPFELDIHVSPPLSESHFKAMFKILERQHEIRLLSKIIDISYIYEKESEGEISSVVQLLQSMQDINAYVLLVGSKNRILGICRSDETVPLWDLLQDLNPSGHKYAFVFRKRGNLISFYEALPDLLRSKMLAQTLVTEVSLSKMVLLKPCSVKEALRYSRDYGLAVVCLQEERGLYFITRHDLERLERLGLGESDVLGFSRVLPCFEQQDDLAKAYPILRQRIPLVVKKDDEFYIATTDDLLRQGVVQFYENRSEVIRVGETLYDQIGSLLEHLSKKGLNVYLVGGAIRDYLLGKTPDDIDLCFEGDIEKICLALDELGVNYDMFGKTLSVKCEWNGTKVEFTRARKDLYKSPGVLAEVEPATILEDLERRDFTINAIALQLTPGVSILDPFQGLDDLKDRVIRLIKPWSLREDPSRAFRAINYKNRLNFSLDSQLRQELTAVQVQGKPAPRVLMELRSLLRSSQVFENVRDVINFDLMRFFGRSFVFDERLMSMLEELQQEQQVRTMEVRRIYELVTVILGLGFKDRAERERFFRLLGGAGRLKALSEKLEEEGTIGNLLTDQQ